MKEVVVCIKSSRARQKLYNFFNKCKIPYKSAWYVNDDDERIIVIFEVSNANSVSIEKILTQYRTLDLISWYNIVDKEGA